MLLELAMGLGMVGAVGGLVYAGHRRKLERGRKLGAPWARLGSELGLSYHARLGASVRRYTLSGIRAERPVQLWFQAQGKQAFHGPSTLVHVGTLTARVPVRVRLPAGLELRHESLGSEALRYVGIEDLQLGVPALDDALRVRCDDPDALRRLCALPAVQGALARHLVPREGSVLTDAHVELTRSGEDPSEARALLDAALALAEALEAAVGSVVDEAIRGLGLRRHAAPADGMVQASGVVHGLAVRVAASARQTEVRVALPLDAPAGLSIRARVEGAPVPPGFAVPLANPLLARLVHARADDPDRAARQLGEELTEPLLAVVRGRLGAWVGEGEVVVPLAGLPRAVDLAEVLDEAVRLAVGLGPPG